MLQCYLNKMPSMAGWLFCEALWHVVTSRRDRNSGQSLQHVILDPLVCQQSLCVRENITICQCKLERSQNIVEESILRVMMYTWWYTNWNWNNILHILPLELKHTFAWIIWRSSAQQCHELKTRRKNWATVLKYLVQIYFTHLWSKC